MEANSGLVRSTYSHSSRSRSVNALRRLSRSAAESSEADAAAVERRSRAAARRGFMRGALSTHGYARRAGCHDDVTPHQTLARVAEHRRVVADAHGGGGQAERGELDRAGAAVRPRPPLV